MDSTLDDRFAEGQIASLEEQLSNLAREAGVNPSAPQTSMKTSRAPLATFHRLADWRHVAFVGSLLAASIGVAAWCWSSSVDMAKMTPLDPAPLSQAASEVAAPKDVAPTAVALSFELAQQLQPMARDLAASSQAVEQLKVRQEQLVRDNENLASQLKASREEMDATTAPSTRSRRPRSRWRAKARRSPSGSTQAKNNSPASSPMLQSKRRSPKRQR
jgi:hypothetical protein